MKISQGVLKGIFIAAAAALCIGGIGALEHANANLYPAVKGQQHLSENGYTVLGGGERDVFNTCGKGIYARSYEVITPSGAQAEQTVCFSPYMGPHTPLFQTYR